MTPPAQTTAKTEGWFTPEQLELWLTPIMEQQLSKYLDKVLPKLVADLVAQALEKHSYQVMESEWNETA